MSFLEQKKKQFIRWYYGAWVNDPQAEVPMFGAVIPYRALQLHAAVRWIKRQRLWLVMAAMLLVILCVVSD